MKKIITIVCLLVFGLTQAQDVTPKFEKAGDLVKATYFYNNGKVKEQGFFKDKKLSGTWVSFDKIGNKTAVANYKAGKKVGKWFMVSKDGVKELTYTNNKITNVNSSDVAIK